LTRLDQHIAYLSGHEPLDSVFVKAYAIEARLPLKLKQINRYLQQHHISRVNLKQRGTGLSPDQLAGRLKPAKEGLERTLILVRVKDAHHALICRRQ